MSRFAGGLCEVDHPRSCFCALGAPSMQVGAIGGLLGLLIVEAFRPELVF
jgi:hypothetical protein